MLSQDLLKELFKYDPESGIFLCKKSDTRKKEGDVVGCLRDDGYLLVRINCKQYLLHRLAFLYMEGEFPEHEVDHINRRRADNRWKNLRHATHKENLKNQNIRSNNTSGATGVFWDKNSNKWRAKITINGKNKHLGYFTKLKDAKAIRRVAEKQHGFIGE